MSELSTVEVLRKARDLISEPERWTQRAYARDEDGQLEDLRLESAVCWCATGALFRVSGDFIPYDDMSDLVGWDALQAQVGPVISFNDATDTTHADVMVAFDRPIAAEESHDA